VTADKGEGYSDPGADGPDLKLIDEIMMNLSTIGSREQWYHWRNELFSQQTVDFRNKAAVRAWHEAIYRQHGPRLAGHSPCTLRRALFYASKAPQNLPVTASVPCDGSVCVNRSVTAATARSSFVAKPMCR